jgi:hypothetical protein
MDALVAEIEPRPQSRGDRRPENPAVETRPGPIASADYPAVLQRIIIHVIDMVRETFVVFTPVHDFPVGQDVALRNLAFQSDQMHFTAEIPNSVLFGGNISATHFDLLLNDRRQHLVRNLP